MPLWGVLALGTLATLGGWLLGSRRVTQSLVAAELSGLAKSWDKLSREQQDRAAARVVKTLSNSGSVRTMMLGASFLEDMDRMAEAIQLRTQAAAITAAP